MYKVYKIEPRAHYHGLSLVAAENPEEANALIDSFRENDTCNYGDSWGYCRVGEDDVIEDVFSERKGIMLYGIYYYG